MSIPSSRRPPRRSRPTATPRCGSSRSAALTCSRCTCGAIRISGSGCTAAGGTTRRRPQERPASFRLPTAMPTESTTVKRLLIVAPNWLGDAVMALPAIADVRRALPDAAMTVAALLAKAGWDGRRRLAALAPGAAYGGAKRWAPERFAELAAELAADGVQPVIIGSAADREAASAVTTAFRRARNDALIDLTGGT